MDPDPVASLSTPIDRKKEGGGDWHTYIHTVDGDIYTPDTPCDCHESNHL